MNFHITIDFFDDLFFGKAEWDEPTLRNLIRELAERGISTVHWLDYGGIHNGGWDAGSYFDPDGKGQRFIHAVPDPLKTVCDEAHRHGMEVCSVLKIHDLALGMPFASYPLGAGPRPPVGLPHVGGTGSWGLRWLREHPETHYRLHPALIQKDSGQPIKTIRLWHESAVPPDPMPEFELWVSKDNGTYLPYKGPMNMTREVRSRRPPIFTPAPEKEFGNKGQFFCMEWKDLNITEPFICIYPRQPVDFANTLAALVEVEDAKGQTVSVTFGVTAYQPYGQSGHDWRKVGIAFDTSRRTLLPGRGKRYSAGRARFSLSEKLTGSPNKQKAPGDHTGDEYVILGLARGRNEFLTGLTDMAHESVRSWLCEMISHALDVGADAVDIRSGSHTETLDWENYGFSKPVMAEFQRRHGVDVAAQPFDRKAWQELQGEVYDRFMAQAAQLVHSRKAKFYAHIMPVMEGLPEWPKGAAFHNQQWNWRHWIKNKWLDGVTIKGCQLETKISTDAMSLCRQYERKTLLNNKPRGSDKEKAWLEAIAQAEAASIDTFNIYECASLIHLMENGKLEFKYPELWNRVAEKAMPEKQGT